VDKPGMNDKEKHAKIRFVDNYFPALEAGTYTIKVEQTLTGSRAQTVDEKFVETQEFKVRGPRFWIDPADIQQLFPPANSQGRFQDDLPHIVLTKRTLPWERSLYQYDPAIPWMALLLFDPSEILPPVVGTNKDSPTVNPSGLTIIEVKKLLDKEEGVLKGFDPDISLDETDQNQNCQVIDISPDTFRALIPKKDELKYLTHCREVQMDQKAVSGPEHPGADQPEGNGVAWFSVVVSGRFPSAPPAEGRTGQQNIVHLVSLEGLGKYIEDPEAIPQGIQRIRLVSLAKWVFTCLPEQGEDFPGLMNGLLRGNSLMYKLPYQPPGTKNGNADFAVRMLEAGYVPRSYQTRQGEKTFAWYRGPFTPQLAQRFPADHGPFTSAAQAVIYDPDHGLFDMSYAVAWEIGRLLALSDQRFGMLLLNRRRKARHLEDLLKERIEQVSPYVSPGGDDKKQQKQKLLEGNYVSDMVLHHLVSFAREVEPKIFPPVEMTASNAIPVSPVEAARHASKKDDEGDSQDPSTKIDGEELEKISSWLANLYLLYGVPFNHLVPDERLLPQESIRFFYLDRNWLDLLLDGALSIGMHSSRDLDYQKTVYGTITDMVHERIQTMRDRLLGNHNGKVAGNNNEMPLAGMLIRSAVVSGWPGLEVRAYRASDGNKGTEPVGLLRMDRPAPDVLFCIFNQIPAWVEFNEPKEGLHFGVEKGKDSQRVIDLRDVNGANVGCIHIGERIVVEPDRHRRLPITEMRKALDKEKTALGLDGAENFSPAAFALQMVKVPQQMVFQTTRNKNVACK
jgi:hypothetical protein